MTPVVARLCAGQRRISLKAKSFTLAPLRYIAAGNAALGGDLPLGSGRAVVQAVAQDNDPPLPVGQALRHKFSDLDAGVPGVQILQHIIIHANDVHQRQGVSIAIRI